MGMFPATTQRDIEAAFQKELDAEPLPFGEGVAAARGFADLTGRSDSLSAQVKDRTVRSLQALTDHTGEQFAVPDGTWSNRQAMQQLATLDQRKDAIAALRTPEFGPPDLRLQTGAEIQGAARSDVAAAQAKASRAGLGAQLAGGAVSSLTDPLNMALLPLGVFSAEGIMAKLGIEFAIGAGSQTLVEAASAPAKEFAGIEQTAGETATNILATGVLGAGLVGAFHGAGLVARRVGMLDAYHAKVRAGEIVPNRETTAAADAIQDALDTTPPGVSPEAEGAHLDAVAAGTDVLRAESDGERAAALKRLDEAAAVVSREAPPPRVTIKKVALLPAEYPKPEPGVFYHGSGTEGLTPDVLDSTMTKADSLFGSGIYLTDSRKIAEGYARSRAKRTGTPVVYRAELGDVNLLDLEGAPSDDVLDVFMDAAGALSDEHGMDETIERVGRAVAERDLGEAYRKLSEDLSTLSYQEEIPDYEIAEILETQITDPLRRLGYDGFTHTGGKLTGNAPHRVAIIFDPQDLGMVGRRPDIRAFSVAPEKYRRALGFNIYEREAANAAVSAELASPTPHIEAPDPAAPLAKATQLPSGPNEAETGAVGATSAEVPPAYSSGDPEADALLGRLLTDDPDAAVTIEVDGVETTGRLADVNAALDRELAELDGTTDCLIGGGF